MSALTMADAYSLIRRIKAEVNNPKRQLGYQWECKQDLYILKWACEQAIAQCDTYEGEEEYVKRYENKQLLQVIKGSYE